jgi:hypothetical protein
MRFVLGEEVKNKNNEMRSIYPAAIQSWLE